MENQKIKDNNYIAVQGWMCTKLGLSGSELICYAIIYGFCQDNQSVFSGTASYIASWLNIDKRRAYDVLKRLTEKGLIIKIEKEVNGVKLCDYKTAKINDDENTSGVVTFRQGGSDVSSPHNIEDNINKKEIYKEKPYKESFEQFWSIYPKQRAGSKEKAYISFCKAIKENRATEEKIIHSAELYAKSDEVKRGFAKGCAAWLNDDRFNNDYGDKENKEDFDNLPEWKKLAMLRGG